MLWQPHPRIKFFHVNHRACCRGPLAPFLSIISWQFIEQRRNCLTDISPRLWSILSEGCWSKRAEKGKSITIRTMPANIEIDLDLKMFAYDDESVAWCSLTCFHERLQHLLWMFMLCHTPTPLLVDKNFLLRHKFPTSPPPPFHACFHLFHYHASDLRELFVMLKSRAESGLKLLCC